MWSILCFWKIKLGNVYISDIEYFARGFIRRTRFFCLADLCKLTQCGGFLISWCYYLKHLSYKEMVIYKQIPAIGHYSPERQIDNQTGNCIIHFFLKFYVPCDIYLYIYINIYIYIMYFPLCVLRWYMHNMPWYLSCAYSARLSYILVR